MSVLRPLASQWRTPEFKKAIVASTWRGTLRVQSWPRARGPAKTEADYKRQQIFALYQILIKRLTAWESNYERDAIRDYNRKNRGQRGSAAIRFRDWQTQRLYGRGVGIVVSPTLTIYPPAIARDASFILDHCTDQPYQILQRSDTTWGAIPQGNPGAILTASTVGSQNNWHDMNPYTE